METISNRKRPLYQHQVALMSKLGPILLLLLFHNLQSASSEKTCRADDKECQAEKKACVDSNEQCQFWASQGECRMNSKYMHKTCKKSCGKCADKKKYDEAMQPLVFELPGRKEVSMVYVQPDVSTFYEKEIGSLTIVESAFKGREAKFINFSPDNVDVYWIKDLNEDSEDVYISTLRPYAATGFPDSIPGYKFVFALTEDGTILKWVEIVSSKATYIYDAYRDSPGRYSQEDLKSDKISLQQYQASWKNLFYGKSYFEMTGREWIGYYPRKELSHMMLSANFFGQAHRLKSREVHFVKMPPQSKLGMIEEVGEKRQITFKQPRLLQDYRAQSYGLPLTITSISCAPRVFEIKNFVSSVEAEYIIGLGTDLDMARSKVNVGITKLRTSTHSWIYRETSPIIDAIYRRAADVLGVDEALFRERGESEYPDLSVNESVAEPLQLVHYGEGQIYAEHHDFSYPHSNDLDQPARFATMLIYLNDGMEGGETEFPKWANAETPDSLKIQPETGKAVVFYNMLPDGNYDEMSLHQGLPVISGEKWLMNLWVWDPFIEPN